MLVSAISQNSNAGYRMSSNKPLFDSRNNEMISDTAFNSLTPTSKTVSVEKLPHVYDQINEWQTFCHDQIMGGKLNIIA